ncbi:MAG: hypothetical protein OSB46_09180 [Alphaproteobacteria bacterium]|nr:hypothetical protein [Alphaproteobacteria bacterium]
MKAFAAVVYVCLASVTGFALFHITYKVEQLEAQLSQLNKEILLEQNTVHVLKAEWSFLSRPERIDELSRKMLPGLHPLQTRQIGDLDSLPTRDIDFGGVGGVQQSAAPLAPYRPVSARSGSARTASARSVSPQATE